MVVNVTLLNKDLIVKKVGLGQVQMQEDLDLGEIKTGERMVYLIAVRQESYRPIPVINQLSTFGNCTTELVKGGH